ncbi:hypothetical protein [Clostridium sp. BJN0001]|uniref:hypothetical protein n=1 Tax=Clostridium sp. BJN0001 TaxID=2930219 RepID=UPI001FD21CC6|nr:hypothetical protein [Clostridium sp. BJN0001]
MNRKNGFTVIETTVYVFITSLLMFIGISVFVFLYKNYLKVVNKVMLCNYIEQYFLSIDNMITEGSVKSLDKDSSAFFINRDTDLTEANGKRINKMHDKLIVTSCAGSRYLKTYNTLIEGIDNFEVILKGKVYYLIISMKDGRKIIRSV